MVMLLMLLIFPYVTTCGSRTMFKKQPLSFYVVSKTFIPQNYLSVIPSSILWFLIFYHYCLAPCKPRDNRGKHNLKSNIISEIILITYANALTRTRSY